MGAVADRRILPERPDLVDGPYPETPACPERGKAIQEGRVSVDDGLGIIGRPDLLFLDEPTTGFDPSARRGAWDVVRSLAGAGTTILLTTHYMDEAQHLADRVAVINQGRIVTEGSTDSIGGRADATVRIRFAVPAGTSG